MASSTTSSSPINNDEFQRIVPTQHDVPRYPQYQYHCHSVPPTSFKICPLISLNTSPTTHEVSSQNAINAKIQFLGIYNARIKHKCNATTVQITGAILLNRFFFEVKVSGFPLQFQPFFSKLKMII
jgi:hypothetical protein